MTLIGAFSGGLPPHLVGDLYLSSPTGAQVGVRRKLEILRPHLAVGWTGHEIAAAVVLSELRARLPSNPTLAQAEELLTSLPPDVAGTALLVRLIAAHVDDTGSVTCFLWNSQWPAELFMNDPILDGSGSLVLDALHRGMPPIDVRAHTHPAAYSVTYSRALMIAGLLAEDEIGGKTLHDIAVGQAYEVVIHTPDSFVFASDILYIAVEASFDAVGQPLGLSHGHSTLRVWSWEDYSYSEVTNHHTSHRSCAFAAAPGVATPNDAPRTTNDPRIRALWQTPPFGVYLYLWLSGPDLPSPVLLRTFAGADVAPPPFGVNITENDTDRWITVFFAPGYLEERYRTAVERSTRDA